MPTPAQTAAAATAVGGGALGGYVIANAVSSSKTESKTTEQKDLTIPTAVVFKSSTTFQSGNPYFGKLLSKTKKEHLDFLVKPFDDQNNVQKWWDWAFTNKFLKKKDPNKLDSIFSSVDSGYAQTSSAGNDPKKSLNQACEKAYIQEPTLYKFTDDSHLLKNISDFCTKDLESKDISEPIAETYTDSFDINNTTNKSYKYGVLSQNANKLHLVKKDETNRLWWEWSYKNLLTQDKKTQADDLFKNLEYHFKSDSEENSTKALNQACDSSYKKPYFVLSGTPQKLFENIKEFCTVGKTKASLTLPIGEPTGDEKVKFLSSVTNLSNEGYTSTFSTDNTNKTLLVNPKTSSEWWDWNYGNYFPWDNTVEKGKLKETFSKVDKPWDQNEGDTSLNGACKVAYKETKTNLENTDQNKISLFESIKKFCVPTNKRNSLTKTNS